MKLNTTNHHTNRTHEGAVAYHLNAEFQLRRSVMACMLWEDSFYEDGQSIAQRITDAIGKVSPDTVADMAIEAREKMKLRHAPLLLCNGLAKAGKLKADTLARVIQRADELAEFLAIYWQDGRCPIAGQVKKGLAKAFTKFDGYSLAKYNRDGAIKLRDVLFMCHAKPTNDEQAALWKQLVEGSLATPDTWEVSLTASGGENKKDHWERLLRENKLGALALLRNLRNMKEADVDETLIYQALDNMDTTRVLPFRFIAAAKYAPQWEPHIEKSMLKCLSEKARLSGKTVLLVDVSGSMDASLSSKSDMNRLDAACGLAICLMELCEDVQIFTFSNEMVTIPPRHGFALRDAIVGSQHHGGTYLGNAVKIINEREKYSRLVVITDEQSRDSVPLPSSRGYMLNISTEKNGVGYGKWLHCDGFSEAIVDYLVAYENSFDM